MRNIDKDFTMDFSKYFGIGGDFGGLVPQGDEMLTTVINDSIMVIWQVSTLIDSMEIQEVSAFTEAFRNGVIRYSLVYTSKPYQPFGALVLSMEPPIGIIFVAPYVSSDGPAQTIAAGLKDFGDFCGAAEPSIIFHLVDGRKLAASMAFVLDKRIAHALQSDVFDRQHRLSGIKDNEAAMVMRAMRRRAKDFNVPDFIEQDNYSEEMDAKIAEISKAVKIISVTKPLSLILGPQFARRHRDRGSTHHGIKERRILH